MITKDNNLRVMELFFKNPSRKFHLREIARLTRLSSTGVIKLVARLKKENLLISKKSKITHQIVPAFERRFPSMKRVYNLYSLYDTGLVHYLTKLYEQPRAIIVFGSYADGTDTEKSDVDIAVINDKNHPHDLMRFEKMLSRKIRIHVVNPHHAKKEFLNSLANGIVLQGFAEVIE